MTFEGNDLSVVDSTVKNCSEFNIPKTYPSTLQLYLIRVFRVLSIATWPSSHSQVTDLVASVCQTAEVASHPDLLSRRPIARYDQKAPARP